MISDVNSPHCLPCRTSYTMESREIFWMTICTVNYYCHYLQNTIDNNNTFLWIRIYM
jgi:hypothetical protein